MDLIKPAAVPAPQPSEQSAAPPPDDSSAKSERYETPGIKFVGNLNDLLAGGGSHDTDVQGVCNATGPIVDPSCM